jgi:hypothetical protein
MGRPMNQQDRDRLRQRHIEIIMDGFTGETGCMFCCESWPCDVIIVLDAWEAKVNKPLCDHLNEWGEPYTDSPWFKGQTCPKCGEKL